ncbi:glycosyltransferase [candidate division WWE3 bacterium]|jgi:glycosyltransferase involved in cell wall biosynthesis|uniref:Glycosyltransferase n=1 Tax=candidate division WWE3 bacterium TaxID=2053526 RepID=A0A3A4ZDK5_UNCKA|nr:MAG: glycosyltransferase [candidate division WWE3 bacterium]
MEKPRIIIVMSCYYPYIGGAENQAKLLGEKLAEKGWKITVLTKKRRPDLLEFEKLNGVSIFRVNHGVPGICYNLFRFRSMYDVVIFAGQLSNASKIKVFFQMVAGAALKLLFKKKVFLWPTSGADRYKLLLDPFLSRKLLQFFDGILCKSNEQFEYFSEIAGKEAEVYAPPWSMVDVNKYNIPDENEVCTIRNDLGIPNDAIVLLFTGRLFEGKGIDLLLDAFEALYEDSKLFLLIAGAVPVGELESNPYVNRIKNASFYTGSCLLVLNDFDTEKYFKAADIFVFPTYSEGCPVVQLEAMATGLLCVASDLTPIKEKIRQGETGYLFRSGDLNDLIVKIKMALSNLNNKVMRSTARLEVSEKYSIENVTCRWENQLTEYWLRTTHGVIMLTPWAYPRIGGIQKISLETAKRLVRQGFKVTIVTRKHINALKTRETIEGIRLVRLSCIPYVMYIQLSFLLVKEWNNFRHFSVWGAYGSFINLPILIGALVLRVLGKKVSVRLSNQLMDNEVYAEKVTI